MGKYSYINDISTWREEFSFFINVNIRFSETDMFGHMNNVSAFTYFEEARITYMEHIQLFDFHGDYEEVPIVADLQCDYHAQVFFGENLQLYVKTAEVGKSSMDIHYMALKKDKSICFTGRGKLVKINARTGRPVQLTEAEIAKLTNHSAADRIKRE